MPEPNRKSLVKLAGIATIVAIVLASAELFSAAIFHFAPARWLESFVYIPPAFEAEEVADYRSYYNPLTGWPRRNIEQRGPVPRHTPDSPAHRPVCLSAYGDSFVHGSEVPDADAWSNHLARNTECRIANYGVGGFGTDQAFLLFRDHVDDAAPITMLGVYPHNFLRNVNQYRYFLAGSSKFALKPRFSIEHGELVLVPLPLEALEVPNAIRDRPAAVFTHEPFLPGTRYGPVRPGFPYTVALMRIAMRDDLRNWARGRPSWFDFAQPGHPTQAMEVTLAIVREYAALCLQRRKNCFVVLFPTPASIAYHASEGRSAMAAFRDAVEAIGMPVLDLEAVATQQFTAAEFCSLLTKPQHCEGHFNAHGNMLLADAIESFVADRLGASLRRIDAR